MSSKNSNIFLKQEIVTQAERNLLFININTSFIYHKNINVSNVGSGENVAINCQKKFSMTYVTFLHQS